MRASSHDCSKWIGRERRFCTRPAHWFNVSADTGTVLGYYCDGHRDLLSRPLQFSLFEEEPACRNASLVDAAPRRGK